jgi:hypothetical protein
MNRKIKEYQPDGVVEFMIVFMEQMSALKTTFPDTDYATAKDRILDELADELNTPKEDFKILMSGLEVICDWEDWYEKVNSQA